VKVPLPKHHLLARLIQDSGLTIADAPFANSGDTEAANTWRKSPLSQSTIIPSGSLGKLRLRLALAIDFSNLFNQWG
jgi:hypothetical protein